MPASNTDPATNPITPAAPARGRRPNCIALPLKIVYTAFLAVLVPYYLKAYGPTNFLYFCDVALLMTLIALWAESPLWASMPAVGILFPQSLWCVDFLGSLVGHPVTGMSAYMFNSNLSLFTRGLSSFHFWLPFLLVFIVWKVGYDHRALASWTALALILMLVCYFFFPAPPPPADNPDLPVNINYVYGLSDDRPQKWMPAPAWLALLMVTLPVAIYLPTHLLLRTLFGKKPIRDQTRGTISADRT